MNLNENAKEKADIQKKTKESIEAKVKNNLWKTKYINLKLKHKKLREMYNFIKHLP